MQSLMLEMNSTSMSKGWFTRTFNMLRWMIIDNDLPMGGNRSQDVIADQIRSLYDHNVFVHWQHSKNIQIHDKSYKSAFDRIMLYNPCPVIIDKSESAKIENCENFMEKVVTKGMTIALIRNFENMKRMELFYRHYLQNPSADFIYPDNVEQGEMVYVNMTNNT